MPERYTLLWTALLVCAFTAKAGRYRFRQSAGGEGMSDSGSVASRKAMLAVPFGGWPLPWVWSATAVRESEDWLWNKVSVLISIPGVLGLR